MKTLVALAVLALLSTTSCAPTGGNRTPKSMDQAKRWAAEREARRYRTYRHRPSFFKNE